MPNYKPYGYNGQVGSQYHFASVPKDDVKILSYNVNKLTTVQSLVDIGTTVYQVPTGKKFVCTTVFVTTTATAGPVVFTEGTLDTGGTSRLVFQGRDAKATNVVPCSFEIAAGKYLNVEPTTTNIWFVVACGYLEDV